MVCWFCSDTYHPEIFLGDDQVYNVTNSSCDDCIGLRPYSFKEEVPVSNVSSNRVRRNDATLYDPLPPQDGNLDVDSNYTGFVEIIGEAFRGC